MSALLFSVVVNGNKVAEMCPRLFSSHPSVLNLESKAFGQSPRNQSIGPGSLSTMKALIAATKSGEKQSGPRGDPRQ